MMAADASNKENVPPASNFHGVIHVNGFKFHKKVVCKKYTIYWCSNRRNSSCSVKAHVKLSGDIEVIGEHSELCMMKTKCAKRVLQEIEGGEDSGGQTKKKVGDYTGYMLQRATEIGLENRSMAPSKVAEIIFDEMKKKKDMSWRGATHTQVVNKCRNARAELHNGDVYRTIETPEVGRYADSNLWFLQFNLSLPVKNQDRVDRIVGFGHPALLSLISGTNELFIDGTFKIVPRPFYQVLVIMCYDQQTRVYVPVMYILMTGKTELLYRHALYWANAIVLGHSSPRMVTCDFEKALMNAVKSTFKNVTVNGCLFHWKQAILRKLKEFRFTNQCLPFRIVSCSVLDVLTVIPRAEVPTTGIRYVKSIVQDMDLCESDNFKMGKFWTYFEKTWLPLVHTWNIRDEYDDYVKILARTNNGLERYNKRLNSLFNTNRLSILSFISILKKESTFQVDKLDKIRHGFEGGDNDFSEDVDYDNINMNLYFAWVLQQQQQNEN